MSTFKSASMGEALNSNEVSEANGNFEAACQFYAGTSHLPDSVKGSLAWQAWDFGHSSGLDSVWFYYQDLADLVLKAFDAGKNSK